MTSRKPLTVVAGPHSAVRKARSNKSGRGTQDRALWFLPETRRDAASRLTMTFQALHSL
jgi:hypothetical protein